MATLAESSGGDNAAVRRMGQMVLERGLLNDTELDLVLQKQAVEGGRLGNMLVSLGLVTEKEVARILADQYGHGIEFLDKDWASEPTPEATRLFNQALCLARGFLPLDTVVGSTNQTVVTVLIGDADPGEVSELVWRRTGWQVRFQQGEFARVNQAIRQHFFFAEHPPDEIIQRELRQLDRDVDRVYSPDTLLEYILHYAVRERASDIHITASPGSRHILFRVDGVLRPMLAMSSAGDRLTGYIKLCSEMDVAEQRLPQDGSFSRTILDQPYTIRVSTVIAEYGERMVLRLLGQQGDLDKLSDLGVLDEDIAALKKLFASPQGLILLTGPTGSGKSTTLHAALRMQHIVERNVLTVEDPVEYRVPAVGQTEVNGRAGYGFSNALRHFLRHDPDIILVGEIRDQETAHAGLEAASTGHLVLSTLHVGSIFGVVPRLKILGIDVETIAENLMGVINQRLARRNCPMCKTATTPSEAARSWLGIAEGATVMRGAGCQRCRGTGYLGRVPVYEMLLPDRTIADLIASDAPRGDLRAACEATGMRTILESGRQRVLEGETTTDEIERAIGEGAT